MRNCGRGCELKFTVKVWKLEELYIRRNQIEFPVYQRGEVWSEGKKKLLIDSIFKGIDIPKLYLQYVTAGGDYEKWDCIDGHQRIRAIVGYFDGEFKYDGCTFDELSDPQKHKFEEYNLTIAEVTKISDEEVRLLFQRLQLGLPLNSGEKLNSILSNLGEFIKFMVKQQFIQRINVPSRRFAKEQVCAQICNNSAFINKADTFRNSKYEDLAIMYTVHKDFDVESDPAKNIMRILTILDEMFGVRAAEITNRASVVSVYLMVEEMYLNNSLQGQEGLVGGFYLEFLKQLRNEVKLGIDATDRFLLLYQSRVIQAADSRTAIAERHDRLKEAFQSYLATGSAGTIN